jgi:hypothetical protein
MNRITRKGKGFGIRLATAGVAVCAIALALALPAIGHKVIYPTNLQLKIDSVNTTTDQYSGKVTSTRAACTVGRAITVSVAGVPIATTFSNLAGDWAVLGPTQPRGVDVTAFTPKKILKKNRRHRHRCAAALTTRKTPGP